MTSDPNDLDAKLRALSPIEPSALADARALRSLHAAPRGTALPLAARAFLIVTVLTYLGWAFRAATALSP